MRGYGAARGIAAAVLLLGPLFQGTARAPAKAAPLVADAPRTTVEGNTFVAPAGWSAAVRGPVTTLEPPEGDSHIALVDVRAPVRAVVGLSESA